MNIKEARRMFSPYIEAIDTVFNSNTFICLFDLSHQKDFKDELMAFLHDGLFTEQMFLNDEEGEWCNYTDFDTDLERLVYPPIQNYFVKVPTPLSLELVKVTTFLKHFTNLLSSPSPHGTQLTPSEAHDCTHVFIETVTKVLGAQPICHFIVPNFLHKQIEMHKDSALLSYFEGAGYDTATTFAANQKALLLLTNGMP